ncbi:MAG: hypothetical protein IPM52_13220 [Bacteroidetes bacterium]|nr:hypothetical protein [Bacteroidota bacterium]
MSNILEYTLNLKGNLETKLLKIGINNDKQLNTWAKVQQQVNAASDTMNKMGRTIGAMNERIAALRAQREWIPASNRSAIRQANIEIKALEKEISKLENLNGGKFKSWFDQLKSAVPGLEMVTNPLVLGSAAVYRLTQALGGSKQAYMEESVEVAKLQQVMRNAMNARADEVRSILDLASAQQRLGVIGDETQLAGAQELATYLTKSESLRQLLPAMNDMLAQQYGLNATQEQAIQIGSMLGKVMNGQVEALSRYGYKFDEAQQKILKTGTEAERVAVLFDVVNRAVGGVNQQLANTPEGKLKQQANNLGDLQERMGKLVVLAEASFAPVIASIGQFFDKVIGFFEQNQDIIQQIIGLLARTITGAFSGFWAILRTIADAFGVFVDKIKAGSPLFIGLASAITGVATALLLMKGAQMASIAWSSAIMLWNNLQTASWWRLNAAIFANPVTWIIASIVALVALIGFLIVKLDGWSQTWKNLMNYLVVSWQIFKTTHQIAWLEIQDTFLTGIELIQRAWYKLQALWDKDAARAGLATIENKQLERAAEIAAAKGKMDQLQAQRNAIKVLQLNWNNTTLGDVAGSLKKKLGIDAPVISGTTGLAANDQINPSPVAAATENITSGGTRNTQININLRNLVEHIHFEGQWRDKSADMQQQVEQALIRVLNMAYATA